MWNPTEFGIQKLITTNFDVDIWLSNPTTFLQDKMHTTFLQHLSKQKIEEYSEVGSWVFFESGHETENYKCPNLYCSDWTKCNKLIYFTKYAKNYIKKVMFKQPSLPPRKPKTTITNKCYKKI